MSDRNSDLKSGDNPAARALDVEQLDPLSLDEALSLVGEETRAKIIRALGDARESDRVAPRPLSFSEIQERTDVTDSGRFNYHLGELVGPFVRKTADGYVLTAPGQLVYEAFVAGTLTDRPSVGPFDVADCPNCEGRLRGAYRSDNLLVVACDGCETLYDAIHFPPRGVETHETPRVLDAAYQRRHAEIGAMRRGVCPRCGAPVERSVRDEVPPSMADQCLCDVVAVLACTACNRTVAGNPVNVALTAPEAAGFLADHGSDPALSRWWTDPVASARRTVDTVDGGPGAVAMRFETADASLRVVLDDDLQVVTATESPRS